VALRGAFGHCRDGYWNEFREDSDEPTPLCENNLTAQLVALGSGRRSPRPTRRREAGTRGRWWRFALLFAVTALVLVPIAATFISAFGIGRPDSWRFALRGFASLFQAGPSLTWLGNSLAVTGATVIASIAVAAPGGYVLSRGRNRLVSGYALTIFIVQSLPVVMAVVPLFIVFARLGLSDSLLGITIIYIGSTMTVAVWMMAAYFDSIPVSLEEAAWLDGCSVAGSFARVVLRNSLPGVLSTAIFAFLLAWNDYLIAVVFIRSDQNYTLAIGLESSGHSPTLALVMMLPPVLIFAFLNRYFSVGGIGGAVAGT
jgi:multiple sugar transport system permease protein